MDTNFRIMTSSKENSKKTKILICIGCVFLIFMAFFHGSGIFYITDLIQQSNTESFLKEIIPVLFAHPSIHLLGLAVLWIVTLYMGRDAIKTMFTFAVLVCIDALIAFYLGAIIPGILLLVPATSFVFGGIQKKVQ